MNRNFKRCMLTLSFTALIAPMGALAQSKATAAEAVSMVKRAMVDLKAAGNDKSNIYNAVTAKNARWVDRDLYLVVYSMDGVVRAHGANAKLTGNNLLDLLDIDGKPYIRERMELARAKGSFWQDYKFTNPTTKKIEPKSMYCEKLDELVACAGIYKS